MEEGEQDQACLEPAYHTVLAIHPLSVRHQARFQDQGMGAGNNAECPGPDLVSRAFCKREGRPHNEYPAQGLLYTKTQCVPTTVEAESAQIEPGLCSGTELQLCRAG